VFRPGGENARHKIITERRNNISPVLTSFSREKSYVRKVGYIWEFRKKRKTTNESNADREHGGGVWRWGARVGALLLYPS